MNSYTTVDQGLSQFGCPTYKSTERGVWKDNPTHNVKLTDLQKSRVLTGVFKNTASFNIVLGSASTGRRDGRNFLFSGVAPVGCSNIYSLFTAKSPPKEGRFGPKFPDPRALPTRGDSTPFLGGALLYPVRGARKLFN